MSEFKNNSISELPDITKVEFTKVDRNYLKVLLINFFYSFYPFICSTRLFNQ